MKSDVYPVYLVNVNFVLAGQWQRHLGKFLHGVWQAAVQIVAVALLSPIYAPLTTSISSDTTVALILVLMIASVPVRLPGGVAGSIACYLLLAVHHVGSPYFLYGAIGKVWTSVLVAGCVLAGLPLVLKVWLSALLVVIVDAADCVQVQVTSVGLGMRSRRALMMLP